MENITKLKDVIFSSSYGILPPGDCYNEQNPVTLIRATEMKADFKIDYDQGLKVPAIYGESKRATIKKGDVLLAVKGATIASDKCVCYVDTDVENTIINGSIFKFQVKQTSDFKYIAYMLSSDTLKSQMKYQLVANNAVDYLDKTLIKNLLIPLPLKEKQVQIVDIMDNAYKIKQQKEKEESYLLNSINDYLLGELGILVPEIEENTLDNRISYVASNDVIGGRFDPKNYTLKYKKIINAINSSFLDKMTLREVVSFSISGNWGFDESVEDESLIKCLTIRATEFDNRYNLKLDNSRVKYRKYTPKTYEKMNVNVGDILVEKSGGSEIQPVGRVAIIDKETIDNYSLAFSNFIHKIVVNEDIIRSDYLFEYLTLMHNIKVTEIMQNQTNGIRNLIMKEYFRQTILLPDKIKQKEISMNIQQIREKAKLLELEAKQAVDSAKLQVNHLLLGE